MSGWVTVRGFPSAVSAEQRVSYPFDPSTLPNRTQNRGLSSSPGPIRSGSQ